jgi:polyhydroxyalkanoate synthesis regulator phasin
MSFPGSRSPACLLLSCAVAAFACTACVPLSTTAPTRAAPTGEPASDIGKTSLLPYLELLVPSAPAGTAPAPTEVLATVHEAWQTSATPRTTLRYALILGMPGYPLSDPAAAAQLLSTSLESPGDLSPEEIQFATAFLHEFEARADLAAQLTRHRAVLEERLRAAESESHAALSASNAEIARLRREVNVLKEKLKAIAEIEQSLMEQDPEPGAPARAEP